MMCVFILVARFSTFDAEELSIIEKHAVDSGINLWSPSSAV